MEPAAKKRKISTGRHLKQWETLKGQYEGLIDRIIEERTKFFVFCAV